MSQTSEVHVTFSLHKQRIMVLENEKKTIRCSVYNLIYIYAYNYKYTIHFGINRQNIFIQTTASWQLINFFSIFPISLLLSWLNKNKKFAKFFILIFHERFA